VGGFNGKFDSFDKFLFFCQQDAFVLFNVHGLLHCYVTQGEGAGDELSL
jgi:hypothetical protein